MLRGLSTVNLFAADLVAAEAWYTGLLGVEPYFRREVAGHLAYLEYRVGDFQHELGIVDARFAPGPPEGRANTLTYWAVDDVAEVADRLTDLGASPLEPITERGPGFVTASFVDPFGNVLGVMENAHYQGVVDELAGSGSRGVD